MKPALLIALLIALHTATRSLSIIARPRRAAVIKEASARALAILGGEK